MRYLFTLLLLTVSAIAQPLTSHDPAFLQSASTLRRGLVGDWMLEESSGVRYDKSPYGNTLTPTNSPGSAVGKQGYGTLFSASSSQQLSRPDNASLSMLNTSFTVSAWAKFYTIPSSANGRCLVSKWLSTGSTNREFALTLEYATSNEFVFYCSTNGTFAGAKSAKVSGVTVETNIWYFLCAWLDTNTASLNISVNNGTVATNSFSGTCFDGVAPFSLGVLNNSQYFMDGIVDDVGIWKRVLSDSERAVLYNQGIGNHFPWSYGSGNYGNLSTNQTLSIVVSNASYNAFPGLTLLPNGHLLAAWYAGTAHYTTNGVQYYSTSTNQGATWSTPTLVSGSTGLIGGDILLLSNNTIGAVWQNAADNIAHWWVGEPSGDIVTWTDRGGIYTNWNYWNWSASRAVALSTGDLLVSIYGRNSNQTHYSTGVVRSSNNGTNWGSFVEVASGSASLEYSEAQALELTTGQVYLCIRRDAPTPGYVYSISNDGGATWSGLQSVFTSVPSTYAGYPSLQRLRSGGVLMLARYGTAWELGSAVSWDDCASFTSFSRVSASGVHSEYQSPVVFPGTKTVGFVYSQEIAGGAKLMYAELVDR